MGISYDEATKAQAALEDKLLKDPNIVSIGVVEEINDIGEKTGNYVVQVGIISAEIYQNSLNKGVQSIPAEYVLGPKNDPRLQEEKRIRIQVIKEERIHPLSQCLEKLRHQNAIDKLAQNEVQHKFDRTYPFTLIKKNYCSTPLLSSSRILFFQTTPTTDERLKELNNGEDSCHSAKLQEHAVEILRKIAEPKNVKTLNMPQKPAVPSLTYNYKQFPKAPFHTLGSLVRLARKIL